ncbi:hypothetical protein OG987_13315 [Streptomyces sp. NBC_01620]|uniref:hypothetical protein n=1 Tax=Streptomyces sp. NBC_01620 TaxID=2975902 RepID=UPI003863C108|nr:hypothetical protein OG987_13315 [Streptomyces sp. NBC_01620]
MTIVTIGGVTIGLCILAWRIITWYPGHKALRKDPVGFASQLAPFLFAWAYGALTILTIGGLIGWIADTTLWISNWLGDVALVWGVGNQPGVAAAGHTYVPLSQTGGAIVLILTCCVIAAAKKSKHGSTIKAGVWCGICLGTSAGVAGFAAVPLATAANWAGGALYGVVA